ncbi:Crp/Fnr family transcriptional regulator [uncultured Christiangramia sp.]|uniref:Crp/Fnr family transcriptional regulator n=1 Tax=Christiangramia sp. 3-2217-3z TaxID=3417564 RepID=UPI0026088100|nr:Crp/Fnr family transcriptional regulator [uncultured Christiangramia sp.]
MPANILDHISREIDLSDLEKSEFRSILSEISLSKKELLIKPGQTVQNEYFVVEGCLRAYYLDEQGNKHIIQFAIEDWWISDFEAFFTNQPSKLYVEAIEDSKLLSLNRTLLEELYARIPKFERFFRLKTTGAFVSLRKRILSSLEKSNKERYLDFCETYPEIEKRVQNYHIANYLGMKPESLSRIRKELA